MILGELYTKKFLLTGEYDGEWVVLKRLTAAVVSIPNDDPDRSLKLALASIDSWSVVDKNGKMVPVTMNTLKQIEMPFFNEIVNLITEFQKAPKEPS